MSWQGYIDRLKMPDQSGTCPVSEAAICGIEDQSVWASSPGIKVTGDEIKKLAAKDRSSFAQNGAYIGGVRCRLIRDQMDDDKVFALDLKTSADAEGNTFSICVGKSIKAIVIAKGTKDASGGQVSSMVFPIIEYLRKTGY